MVNSKSDFIDGDLEEIGCGSFLSVYRIKNSGTKNTLLKEYDLNYIHRPLIQRTRRRMLETYRLTRDPTVPKEFKIEGLIKTVSQLRENHAHFLERFKEFPAMVVVKDWLIGNSIIHPGKQTIFEVQDEIKGLKLYNIDGLFVQAMSLVARENMLKQLEYISSKINFEMSHDRDWSDINLDNFCVESDGNVRIFDTNGIVNTRISRKQNERTVKNNQEVMDEILRIQDILLKNKAIFFRENKTASVHE